MIINLKKYGNSLVSRDLAKNIISGYDITNEQIDLDFNGVDTVTPSFSHEILSGILDNSNLVRKINFLNTNESVKIQLKKALISIREENKQKI